MHKDSLMQYLKIENKGTSPIECFTTLGISTSRYSDNENTIGTFGSGSKHAVLLLMRHHINPIIYCGKTSLEWYSKPAPIKAGSVSHDFDMVYYRIKGKNGEGTINREEKTSYTLQYGQSDWDEVPMALREFVSNALDRAADEYRTETGKTDVGYIKLCKIEVVDENQVRAKEGVTRVFIALTPEVQKFYSTIGKRFLHFSQPHLLKTVILPKADRNLSENSRAACVYKKGVLIREVRSYGQESVFDYNFGEELQLDESRNLDDYSVSYAVGNALKDADPTILRQVLDRLVAHEPVWEGGIYNLSTSSYESEERKAARAVRWSEAIRLSLGKNGVLCSDNDTIAKLVKAKGKDAAVLKSSQWLDAAASLDVMTDRKVLSKEEAKGTTFSEVTQPVIFAFDDVWGLLKRLNMLNNSEKPKLRCFTEIDSGESSRHGFYESETGTVNINTDHAGGLSNELWMTMLEEVAHHITGATDNSRDFQNFFMRTLMYLHQQTKGK
jgi:hypothetical protein